MKHIYSTASLTLPFLKLGRIQESLMGNSCHRRAESRLNMGLIMIHNVKNLPLYKARLCSRSLHLADSMSTSSFTLLGFRFDMLVLTPSSIKFDSTGIPVLVECSL